MAEVNTGGTQKFRRIAIEEAFTIPEIADRTRAMTHGATEWSLDKVFLRNLYPDADPSKAKGGISYAAQKLQDLSDGRIADMDQFGVDMQLLSMATPGVQMFEADIATELAALSNDRLAEAIAKNPARLSGLACFAPQDPASAAKEMERSINTLGLNGFIVNSHTDGEYLDEEKYWPILEAANALGACMYIHPRCPPNGASSSYRGYEGILGSAGYGFVVDASIHAIRIMVSGVLDRFPNLKFCLGHMGEGIPFWFSRLDQIMGMYKAWGHLKLELMPSEYFKRNFVISTSGVEDHLTLQYTIDKIGVDNVMWAVDYPFLQTGPAIEFMDTAPISDADKAKIYGGNAERIFNIPKL